MTQTDPPTVRPLAALLRGFSLEMTGKDVDHLREAEGHIPAGTRINVTYLAHEDLHERATAVREVRSAGFVPVPHLAARRLGSAAEIVGYLRAAGTERPVEQVLVVGGDAARPEGPYGSALELIASGVLADHGIRSVDVTGYPEGHPGIGPDALWSALEDKVRHLTDAGMAGSVVTQFGFDVDPVLTWIEEVRARGIDLPVRVGVPGPAGIRRLVRYASRFGVGTSAGIAKKYGFSLTNLLGTAGPDRFLHDLAGRYDVAAHGDVRLHFYTFGGLLTTAEWIAEFERQAAA